MVRAACEASSEQLPPPRLAELDMLLSQLGLEKGLQLLRDQDIDSVEVFMQVPDEDFEKMGFKEGPLIKLLCEVNLKDYLQNLIVEEIDSIDTLMEVSDDQLKAIGFKVGSVIKLQKSLEQRREHQVSDDQPKATGSFRKLGSFIKERKLSCDQIASAPSSFSMSDPKKSIPMPQDDTPPPVQHPEPTAGAWERAWTMGTQQGNGKVRNVSLLDYDDLIQPLLMAKMSMAGTGQQQEALRTGCIEANVGSHDFYKSNFEGFTKAALLAFYADIESEEKVKFLVNLPQHSRVKMWSRMPVDDKRALFFDRGLCPEWCPE
jgi:hypothetical protein